MHTWTDWRLLLCYVCGFCFCSHGEPLSSDAATVLQELRGADDHTIINQYFDAIDALVALVMDGRGGQAKEDGLCETVLHLQEVSCFGKSLSAAMMAETTCVCAGECWCSMIPARKPEGKFCTHSHSSMLCQCMT